MVLMAFVVMDKSSQGSNYCLSITFQSDNLRHAIMASPFAVCFWLDQCILGNATVYLKTTKHRLHNLPMLWAALMVWECVRVICDSND